MADGEREDQEGAGAEGDAEGAEKGGGSEGASAFDDALEAGGGEGKGKAGGDAGGKKDTDPAWLSQVADDIRPHLKEYKKPTDLGRAFLAQKKALADLQATSKGLIKPLKEGASKEEVLGFKKSLGLPTKVEDYTLEVPEGYEVSPEREKELRQFALDNWLSKRQASNVWKMFLNFQEIERKAHSDAAFPDPEKLMAQVKEEWGDEYTVNRTAFMRYFREFADDELRTLALTTPLGNNKAFIRSAVKVGKMVGESALHEGRSTPTKGEDDDDYDKSPELRRRR